jgi:hypothetical protein
MTIRAFLSVGGIFRTEKRRRLTREELSITRFRPGPLGPLFPRVKEGIPTGYHRSHACRGHTTVMGKTAERKTCPLT